MTQQWTPHVPGDPMPVDGDTVVSFPEGLGAKVPASWVEWKNVTAYRIHKPETDREKFHRSSVEYKSEDIMDINKIEGTEKDALMMVRVRAEDPELTAINAVLTLDEGARERVIEYLAKRCGYEMEEV